MAQILPSIFGADIMNLQDDIHFLEEEKTEILHVDLMDGTFLILRLAQIRSLK